ncbi:unnamed protein product [Chrysoparadoxa australica]
MKFGKSLKEYKYRRACLDYGKIKKLITKGDHESAKALIQKEAKKADRKFRLMSHVFSVSHDDQLLFAEVNRMALVKIIKKYNKKKPAGVPSLELSEFPRFMRSHHLTDLLGYCARSKSDCVELMTCSICLQLLKTPHRTKCDHVFCKNCIRQCNDDACPLCRQPQALNHTHCLRGWNQALRTLCRPNDSSFFSTAWRRW